VSILGGIVLVGALAAGAYFSRSLFAAPPYTEDNLLTGITQAAASITTAVYTFEGSFAMVPREPGVEPFTVPQDEEAAQRAAAYERDRDRVSALLTLYQSLHQYVASEGSYPTRLEQLYEPGPALDGEGSSTDGFSSWFSDEDIEVLRRGDVQYELLPRRAGARLSIILETVDAQDALRSQQVDGDPSQLTGSTFTLTHLTTVTNDTGYIFFWLPSLPKPFFEQFEEFLGYMPPRMKMLFRTSVEADFREDNPDAKVSLSVEGDFDDLMFKFGGDYLNKAGINYFRLNNFPSLYEAFLPVEKGKWYSISTSDVSDRLGAERDLIPQATPTERPELMEVVEQETAILREVGRIATVRADEKRLLRFVSPPLREDRAGEVVYRYTLELNRAALIPYITAVRDSLTELQARFPNSSSPTELVTALDEMIAGLQTSGGAVVADYLAHTMRLTLIVNEAGMPVESLIELRAAPPDSVERLRGQQGVFSLRYQIEKINEPIQIDIPADATPLDSLFDERSIPLNLQSFLPGTPSILGAFTSQEGAVELE
jgi:hypothetical protein